MKYVTYKYEGHLICVFIIYNDIKMLKLLNEGVGSN